jgi:secreted Zn-dependent insulinase-like peptidase
MMKIDHSWTSSAKEYIELYSSLIRNAEPKALVDVINKQGGVGTDGSQEIKTL